VILFTIEYGSRSQRHCPGVRYQRYDCGPRRRGLPFLPAFQPLNNFSVQLHEQLQRYLSKNVELLRSLLSLLPSGSLYRLSTELALPETKIITDVTPKLQIATSALAEQLKGRVEGVHDLTPRQFEELIAELLTDMGDGRVEITPYSRDGGKDLLAYVDLEIGRLLCLVETKNIGGIGLLKSRSCAPSTVL
jgi:Restriction endonuclease